MNTSVIHIKAPHELHIAVKVAALKAGKSMNQFAVDCLTDAIGEGQVEFTKQVLKPHLYDKPIKTPKDEIPDHFKGNSGKEPEAVKFIRSSKDAEKAINKIKTTDFSGGFSGPISKEYSARKKKK